MQWKRAPILFSFILMPVWGAAQNEDNHSHNFVLPPTNIFNALNWHKTNLVTCDTMTLYNFLDSGYVVVQEYFMLDCQPCITASRGLTHVLKGLRERYPNKIVFFQTVYNDEDPEEDLRQWQLKNNIKSDALFLAGSAEVKKYGGMGMPTIVILGGGRRHKGYYKHQGYSPLENGNIIKAIRQAVSKSQSIYTDSVSRANP